MRKLFFAVSLTALVLMLGACGVDCTNVANRYNSACLNSYNNTTYTNGTYPYNNGTYPYGNNYPYNNGTYPYGTYPYGTTPH